jgi:hypothetical protein
VIRPGKNANQNIVEPKKAKVRPCSLLATSSVGKKLTGNSGQQSLL